MSSEHVIKNFLYLLLLSVYTFLPLNGRSLDNHNPNVCRLAIGTSIPVIFELFKKLKALYQPNTGVQIPYLNECDENITSKGVATRIPVIDHMFLSALVCNLSS